MRRPTHRFLLPIVLITLVSGCTFNRYSNGESETVLGDTVEDANPGYQPGTIQDETGESRRQTDLPE